MTSDTEQTLDLRDYLRPIWRRKWLIAVLVIVVTAGTYVYYHRQERKYTATTNVLIQEPADENVFDPSAVQPNTARNIADEARLLQTPEIAAQVARRLHYAGDLTTLLNDIVVTPDASDDFFTISATATDPAFAADLVNDFAQVFVNHGAAASRGQLQSALQATNNSIKALQAELRAQHRTAANNTTLAQLELTGENLELESALSSATAEQVYAAPIPTTPVSPRPTRNAAFAFALALLLGIIGAFGLERLDRRVSGLGELEPLLESQLLVAVPRVKDPTVSAVGQQGGPPELREAFRTLRATLAYSSASGGATRSLLVTSAVAGEGKTTVVRNLATAYAEVGLRVAIIDCDLRRAELGRVLGLTSELGLADVIDGRANLVDVMRRVHDEGEDVGRTAAVTNGHGPLARGRGTVDAITSGTVTGNVPGLLASARLREVLEQIKQLYDIVILDTPPLLSVSDAVALMPQVDGVVLVSRIGIVTDEQAEAVRHLIGRIEGAHLVGIVANGVRKHAVYAGAYGYGY